MEKLKYPIGRYKAEKSATPRDVARWIDEIEQFPSKLRSGVHSLTDDQLETPYREGSWTIRQLIHHIADSHLNGYLRIKLVLTEDCPVIKPYEQDSWAELVDSSMETDASLDLLSGLHKRWAQLLKSLGEKQLVREFIHPESGRSVVKSLIGGYAWHGKHHLAHITNLKKQENWI